VSKEQAIFAEVKRELDRAVRKHDSFHSAHEGYAVILEELDELWDEVKKRRSARSKAAMWAEAAQVAACAIRFIHDLL
jgi:hypothetical protein